MSAGVKGVGQLEVKIREEYHLCIGSAEGKDGFSWVDSGPAGTGGTDTKTGSL